MKLTGNGFNMFISKKKEKQGFFNASICKFDVNMFFKLFLYCDGGIMLSNCLFPFPVFNFILI